MGSLDVPLHLRHTLIVRITTDARCLVVLNPHQHGCHTFILLLLVGITGLVLSAFGKQSTR